MSVLIFLISLYLISIKAYTLLILVLALFIYPMRRHHKCLPVVLILTPILSFISLTLYYDQGIPEEVRVTHVYSSSVIGKNGFRRYVINDRDLDCQVGDLISGDFVLEPLGPDTNGYVGELSAGSYAVTKDSMTRFRKIKADLIASTINAYGHDRGSLMASLVLGNQDEINGQRVSAMQSMGIMHILSISGFHFALLENVLKKLRLGRWRIGILAGYALFIDSVPGYRTLLTAVYKVAGYFLRRDVDVLSGLFFAMFIQAFLCPYNIFKVGYLLTYLSTMGILMFHRRLERIMSFLPSGLSGSLSLTLAALSLSLPVILSFSPQFSLGVFLGNMILVPLYTIVTYLSFLGIMFMGFPLLKELLLPFIEVFFDLSAYLGGFMSNYVLTLNLELLVFTYVPMVVMLYAFFQRRAYLRGLAILTMILLCTLPWGNSMKIYNKFGHPFIRITHNFMNYDIMDYRVAEEGYIPIRSQKTIHMAGKEILIMPGDKERQVPHILIDGKELLLERDLPYHGGVTLEREYIFMNERIIRVK